MSPVRILVCGVLLGAVLCAGCSTAHRRASTRPLPPDWELTPADKSAPPSPPRAVEPAPAAARPATGWIPADTLGPWQRISAGAPDTYALSTSNGVWCVTVGSRQAHFDGVQVWLGFAPQLESGRLLLHALDVQKNFEPLLRAPMSASAARGLIVLDPGHGGRNTGTRSAVDGRWEKEFTLDWAMRLGPLLVARGWRVELTRTNDTDLSLAERVEFALRRRTDLFLSLHFNAVHGAGREESGLETYCLTPVGMPSNLTRGFADEVGRAFPNNAWDEANLQWAVRVHRALLTVNGGSDRGVRRARFLGVLRGQNCPAVLVEGGYLSNPAEARKISDPAYRQQLAEALAKALE
jgi:N-acetylmuramoyl-L-alanine amidase